MSEIFDRELYIDKPLIYENILDNFLDVYSKLVIFEIGACECEDTIKLSRLFPLSHIISTEPILENRLCGIKYLKEYDIKNVWLTYYAFSDFVGEAEMFISSGEPTDIIVSDWDCGNKSSSLLEPVKHLEIWPWIEFKHKQKVPVTTLDHFVDMINKMPHSEVPKIDKINFIHMDVQGAELKVLSGAQKMLPNIDFIFMEVSDVELYKNQPLKQNVKDFMEFHNFMLVYDSVNEVSGDQLWKRK